ncbi:F-box/kelch-repeat protein At3g23880-like [Cornus florida]|uniref:F-box/kelch-repeat protein At3g23880-like n=1 Tax=Cornus florida TaxID=4283 RepID=UPI00289A1001|nr:F-box/kelch-repeat protein At3g23880-like [Cornus florida]
MASNFGNCLVSEDVTIEILSRLCVKSLMRFSCVCKYWYTLARNSTFISKHLHHHKKNPRLLVQYYNYKTEKYVYTLFPDETLSSVPHAYDDMNDLEVPRIPAAVLGPCDGLVCLFYRSKPHPHHMALWNPATKEFSSLPLPNPNYPSHFNDFIHLFGFGLDPLTNDYKVVWMRNYWDDELDYLYLPNVVSVYTRYTDSWRHFEFENIITCSIENSLCNTYTNGFYYWLCETDLRNYKLLSFDMRTDNFKEEIPTPPNLCNSILLGNLTMYNDHIAMFLYDYNYDMVEQYIYTWVMEGEGSWTKHLAIGPLYKIHRPLGIWENGDLFIESETEHLLLYDHSTEEFKNLGPRGKESCLQTFTFQESLVSLKGGNACEERNNYFFLDRVQDFFTFPLTWGPFTAEEI